MSTRGGILQFLRQQSGGYVSGEETSKRLAVSRTAVWKHIRMLREEGYDIDSHPRLGYCLRQTPDLLLPEEILARLNTKKFGREIYYFADIDSTNNEAKKMAGIGCPEGAIVIAESQHGGRGRMARSWFSPAGKGIWLSVILRPSFSPQDAPKCALMTAVALKKAIEEVAGIVCAVKWPNDLLYQGKKVAGILTEMSAEIDAINYAVIGTGINVNIAQQEFPQDISDIATSLSLITGQLVDRLGLLCAILRQLEESYNTVLGAGFGPILDEWRLISNTIGQTVDVRGIGCQFTGVAVDIDDDGALLVKINDEIKKVQAGDVSIRKR